MPTWLRCAVARTSLTLFVLSALLLTTSALAQDESQPQPQPSRDEAPSAKVMSPAQVAAEAQSVITGLSDETKAR